MAVTIPRKQTMSDLKINDQTTLYKDCVALKVPTRFFWLIEVQFAELKTLQKWVKQGWKCKNFIWTKVSEATSMTDSDGISRPQVMEALKIRSRITLYYYCKALNLRSGIRFFTTEEYSQLRALRDWCRMGRKREDYVKSLTNSSTAEI